MQRWMIVSAFVLTALAGACSPPAATDGPMSAAQTQDVLIAALTPVIAGDLGQPVTFAVETARTEGEWGWVIATPKTQAGEPIDFSQTKYAEHAEAGVLDGEGLTYALLQRQNGEWSVKAFVVGPSDVAWIDWPQRYGAPPALMGL